MSALGEAEALHAAGHQLGAYRRDLSGVDAGPGDLAGEAAVLDLGQRFITTLRPAASASAAASRCARRAASTAP